MELSSRILVSRITIDPHKSRSVLYTSTRMHQSEQILSSNWSPIWVPSPKPLFCWFQGQFFHIFFSIYDHIQCYSLSRTYTSPHHHQACHWFWCFVYIFLLFRLRFCVVNQIFFPKNCSVWSVPISFLLSGVDWATIQESLWDSQLLTTYMAHTDFSKSPGCSQLKQILSWCSRLHPQRILRTVNQHLLEFIWFVSTLASPIISEFEINYSYGFSSRLFHPRVQHFHYHVESLGCSQCPWFTYTNVKVSLLIFTRDLYHVQLKPYLIGPHLVYTIQ